MPAQRKWFLLLLLSAMLAFTVSAGFAKGASAQALSSSGKQPPYVFCSPTSCGGGGGGSFYGANLNKMLTATNDWPQQAGNWCGIADASAVARYDWLVYNGTDPGSSGTYQTTVHNNMNSTPAISRWGTAKQNPWLPTTAAPYVKADIAGETGEDPRAQAWAAWNQTPVGYYFHNYIYSPYQGSTNNSATYQVALDFGPAHGLNHPVIVFIWGGRHSLIEDGVYASSDPSAGGETLYAIDLWDSAYSGSGTGYLFGYRNAALDLDTWESSVYGAHGYYFWTYPYDAGDWSTVSVFDPLPANNNIPIDPEAKNNLTRNTGDPDPNTSSGGYYTVHSMNSSYSLQVHWENSFVTVEQDTVTTCSANPSYALDRYGNLAPHNGSTACG